RRQVAQIIFALTAAAPFTRQPYLFAGEVAVSRAARTIGDPHAHGRKPGSERPLSALSPGDAPPTAARQYIGGIARLFAGHGMLAWFSSAGAGEQQSDPGGEDLLRAWDPD